MSEFESKAQIEQLIASKTSHGQEGRLLKKQMKLTNIPLLIMLFVILCLGITILYSVSSPIGYAEQQDSLFYVKKQIRFTLIGLAFVVFFNFIDITKILFRKYMLVCILSGGLALALATATLLFGQVYNNARRWFVIAGFQLQPSEFIKILLVVSFASYRQFIVNLRKSGKLRKEPGKRYWVRDSMLDFVVPVMGAIVVDALILAEPHGSCALIIAAVIAVSALASGIHWRSWVLGIAIMLGFAIVIGAPTYMLMPDEQVAKIEQKVLSNFSHIFKRFEIFNKDENDEESKLTEDDTRQIDSAHYALGSGGMWGVGMGMSRSKYNYISEAQNDYIFSVYVEETGFVGGMFLIIIYMIILAMCMAVIWHTKSVYYRVVATGCTAIIFIEAFMNIAVELQIIPSTGVTLPFISYGGSAQISLLIAFGLILGCSRYGTVEEETAAREIPASKEAPAAKEMPAPVNYTDNEEKDQWNTDLL